DALDRLHSTAASHHRVMVCEVMGRHAGWIALYAGIASGADVILLPEIPFDLECISRFVQRRRLRGRGFSIVCCAEGAAAAGGSQVVALRDETSPDPVRLGGIGHLVASEIATRTGLETRTTVLGHVQRGGEPVPADRILATQFGHHAMELLAEGAAGRMVVMRRNELQDVPLLEVADRQRTVPLDHALVDAGRAMKTCFGDPERDVV
ncbi:MAG: 6-phosphofructokinase, partial [Planctomycetota bacterium]